MAQRQFTRKESRKDTEAGRLIDLVDGGYVSSLLITLVASMIHKSKSSALNKD